jgi:hypothetical protein
MQKNASECAGKFVSFFKPFCHLKDSLKIYRRYIHTISPVKVGNVTKYFLLSKSFTKSDIASTVALMFISTCQLAEIQGCT